MLFIGIAITGCEPMEDIHDDIDEKISNIQAAEQYTLQEEDYEFLDLPEDQYEFDTEDEARELIPVLLSEVYPALGENSSVNVTFNVFDSIRVEEYMVTADDYPSEDYFSGLDDIQDFLDVKFPRAEEGKFVGLTYNTVANEESFTFNDSHFNFVVEELEDIYPAQTGNMNQHGNFERREGNNAYWSNEMILEAINIVLLENQEGVEGQKYNVSYDIYNGNPGTESMTVQFNGNAYVSVGGTAYELTTDDYDLVGAELSETYSGPAGNTAQYHSFDVGEGSDNFWSMDMLLEAFNIALMENYPDAVDGDKFELTYDVYSGGVSTRVQALVLENGSYVVDTEAAVSTIEVTNVFALTNGTWAMPITLEEDDYTEMGQSYPNFDDEEELAYKLSTFLEPQFPYAVEGFMVPVAFDFYNGTSTNTAYGIFVFEDGEFNYVPKVAERSLQFGNNGTEWVPDNTIRYTLSGSDYGIIASVLEDQYPTQVGSMEQYNNFDRREGNSAFWSDEMLVEAMQALLNEIAPDAEVGQPYVLTFDIYNGTNTTESLSLIKDESGAWVVPSDEDEE